MGVEAGDVAARAGEAGCEPGSDEVVADGDDGDRRRLVMGRERRRIPRRDQDVDAGRQKLGDQRRYPLRLSFGIALIEHKIAAENVSPIDKALPQAAAGDEFVVGRPDPDEADPRNLRLLRSRRERPRGSKAHEPDERAPPHSITSSAPASNIGGISIPSALAVLRLTIVLNLVACSIGMSPGFAPLRILSTKTAARRHIAAKSKG